MNTFDPRLTVFYGDRVLRAGFLPVPHLFLRHYRQLGLSTAHAMFLIQIMAGTWDLGDPPRTVGDLAHRLGVDKRTIRKYAQEIAALGLLDLIDRYDAAGGQIENGYDLTELFGRLAELAPESHHSESGTPATKIGEARASPAWPTPLASADYLVHQASAPSADRSILPPEERVSRPGADTCFPPPWNGGSAHDQEERIKNHARNIMLRDEPAQPVNGPQGIGSNQIPANTAGWSIRWKTPLTSDDVRSSADLLRRIGVDRPLRDTLATSLAPAEVWALRAFAAARGWRVGLLIREVYDQTNRRPRPAGNLEANHDDVGRLLNALDASTAEQMLELIERHCPEEPAAVYQTLDMTDSRISSAAQHLWTMMAVLRGRPGSSMEPPKVVAAVPTGHDALETVWHTALTHLRQQVPPDDYATWMASALLLDCTDNRAIIGVPTVFARDALVREYVPMLAAVLSSIFGASVDVEIVVDGAHAHMTQTTSPHIAAPGISARHPQRSTGPAGRSNNRSGQGNDERYAVRTATTLPP